MELKVAKADMGKVIGKQGRTASALRTILSVVSAKEKNAQCSKSWNDTRNVFEAQNRRLLETVQNGISMINAEKETIGARYHDQ